MLKVLFTGRRLWLTLLVLAGVALCCRLGVWQISRMLERQALNEQIRTRMSQPPIVLTGAPADGQDLDYQRVEVRGVYDPSQEIILRPRSLDGITGVHVVTPLRLDGSNLSVLIDRGWLPMELSSPELRRAYAEPGEVVVQGVARRSQTGESGPAERVLGPGETRRDAWFLADITQIEQQAGYPLLPIFIEQQSDANAPALPKRVPSTDLGPGSHLGYVIQWFSFGAILLVGYLVLTYQQMRRGQARAGALLQAG